MRPVVIVLAAVALTACQGTAPPAPLPLSSTFPVLYRGRVAPATIAAPTVVPNARAAALAGQGDSVQCKAIVVELPRVRARQWLPASALRTPPAAATETFTPADAFTIPRSDPISAAPTGSLGVVVPAALLDEAMRDGQCELVTQTSAVAVRVGETATMTAEGRRAFVQAFELKAMGNIGLIGDPQIDVFDYGHRYEFTPRRDADRLQVTFAWHVAEPLWPIPVVPTPYGPIEVPMLVEHQLTGTATVAEQQVFLVGSLPGQDADRVQLLCVAVGVDPLDH
jgi:hypothetical protein